jgi:GNAT superfamily N-acetyltransferase
MAEVVVHSIGGHPEWLEPVATWWHRQWGETMGYSLPEARTVIDRLSAPGGRQVALVALVNGIPSGSVFLVREDLETHKHLSPWLAGLFVLPAYRHMGLGRMLTAAVVEHASTLGFGSIYLYTSIGDYYRRHGWSTCEEILVHDVAHEIMTRTIVSRPKIRTG